MKYVTDNLTHLIVQFCDFISLAVDNEPHNTHIHRTSNLLCCVPGNSIKHSVLQHNPVSLYLELNPFKSLQNEIRRCNLPVFLADRNVVGSEAW